jgi:pyruvate kinase
MKIISSVGRTTDYNNRLLSLRDAGLNVLRIKSNDAGYAKQLQSLAYVRDNCKEVSVMQELQGAMLRVSKLLDSIKKIEAQQEVIFCSEKVFCDHQLELQDRSALFIPIKIDGDFKRLHTATKILLSNSTGIFQVKDVHDGFIRTQAQKFCIVRPGKSLNAPGMIRLNLPLTTKDREDITLGCKYGVDIICASYVTSAHDIEHIRSCVKHDASIHKNPFIWAKIETKEGVNNLAQILQSADGVILHIKNLTQELSVDKLQTVQNDVIGICKSASQKECIVTTPVLVIDQDGQKNYNFDTQKAQQVKQSGVTGFMVTSELVQGESTVECIKQLRSL